MLDTTGLSLEQLQQISSLPSNICLPLMQGRITMQQLAIYLQQNNVANLNTSSSELSLSSKNICNTTNNSFTTSASRSVPSLVPDGIPVLAANTHTVLPNVPSGLFSVPTACSTTTTHAPFTEPAPSVTSKSPFTVDMVFRVLRTVRDENPFAGLNAEQSQAWDLVYKKFVEEGGDSGRGLAWLKVKVGEFLNYHENSKASGVTKIVKDILTDSNHTSLASLLEAIAACRTRACNETSEASSKRRKNEKDKTKIGKLIVEASLQGRRVFATRSANPQAEPEDVHGKLEKTTDEDDDDVLVMDETGAFVAVNGPLPAIKNEINNVVIEQALHFESEENVKPDIQPNNTDKKRRIQRVNDQKEAKRHKGLKKRSLKNSNHCLNRASSDGTSKLLTQVADGLNESIGLQKEIIALTRNQHESNANFQQGFLELMGRMVPKDL